MYGTYLQGVNTGMLWKVWHLLLGDHQLKFQLFHLEFQFEHLDLVGLLNQRVRLGGSNILLALSEEFQLFLLRGQVDRLIHELLLHQRIGLLLFSLLCLHLGKDLVPRVLEELLLLAGVNKGAAAVATAHAIVAHAPRSDAELRSGVSEFALGVEAVLRIAAHHSVVSVGRGDGLGGGLGGGFGNESETSRHCEYGRTCRTRVRVDALLHLNARKSVLSNIRRGAQSRSNDESILTRLFRK